MKTVSSEKATLSGLVVPGTPSQARAGEDRRVPFVDSTVVLRDFLHSSVPVDEQLVHLSVVARNDLTLKDFFASHKLLFEIKVLFT